MLLRRLALALIFSLMLGAASAIIAQEEPPPTPPAKEDPAKEQPAAEQAAAPAETPAPTETPKPLSASAMAFAPLADSYKKAYDDMQAWMSTIDAQASKVDAEIKKLQGQIKTNETAITEAKLAGDSKQLKALQSENKQLTSAVETQQKNLSAARGDYVKQLSQKVKGYQAAQDAALQQVKAATK
jgi:hypothetical protein